MSGEFWLGFGIGTVVGIALTLLYAALIARGADSHGGHS